MANNRTKSNPDITKRHKRSQSPSSNLQPLFVQGRQTKSWNWYRDNTSFCVHCYLGFCFTSTSLNVEYLSKNLIGYWHCHLFARFCTTSLFFFSRLLPLYKRMGVFVWNTVKKIIYNRLIFLPCQLLIDH